jgi:hypothetical protein
MHRTTTFSKNLYVFYATFVAVLLLWPATLSRQFLPKKTGQLSIRITSRAESSQTVFNTEEAL